MLFKDVSEVHNLSVKLNDPTLFNRVVKGAIEDALERHRASSSSSGTKGGSDDDEALRVINARDFPTTVRPRECVVSGIVPERHVTTLYGSGGSTKSILVMSLLLAAGRGDREWLGLPMSGKKYRSLFVDFELDLESQSVRAWQLAKGSGREELPDNFNYISAGGKDPKEVFEFLFNYCKEYAIKLLAVDSVGLAMVGDAGAYRDVVTFFRKLDTFRTRLGCTVILVDHQANLTAGESYQSKAAFGSSYKGNLSRSRVQVELKERAPGVRRVAMRHNKSNFTEYVDPFEVEAMFTEESITLKALKMAEEDLVEEQQLTSWKRGLLLLYKDEEPKTRDDIQSALGVTSGTAANVMSKLRKEDYAKDAGTQSGNQQREISITQTGIDYVEMFLAAYRESATDDTGNGDDDEEGASSSSSPPYRVDDDDEAKKGADTYPPDYFKVPPPVDTPEGLAVLVRALEPAEQVALDLETMPLASLGWIWEVAAEYRAWRRSLKHKPKPERMRAQWSKIKETIYKRYAVNPETAQIRLMSIATDEMNETVDVPAVGDLRDLLEVLKSKTLVIHNAPFDLGVLRERYGYVHEGRVLDTQLLNTLLHYARDGDRSEVRDGKNRLPDPSKTRVTVGEDKVIMSSLLAVTARYLPDTVLDKKQQAKDWSIPNLPPEMISYSLKDSRVLLGLVTVLLERLAEVGMGDVALDIEARALSGQIWMERNGLPASREVALAMGEKYGKEANKAYKSLMSLVEGLQPSDGTTWSWTKPAHVLEVLGTGLGADIKKLGKTDKTGEPSTSKASLQKLKEPEAAVAWVQAFLAYKDLQKRSSDFVDKYAELIRDNGTIPGRFDTVSTGRYNCTKPNLQQVPKRGELQTKEGMRIRDVFQARPERSLVVADFEQVELLLAATIAERRSGVSSKMLEVFRSKGSDIHQATAAWVVGKPASKITRAERSLAKAINFGLIYGCSAEKLLESATIGYGVEGMTLKDAKKYRKVFFEKYPEFEAWHKKVSTDCKNGLEYATTPRGRRRKLPTWSRTGDVAFTTAVNHPVQGAGADAIKLTLATLFEDRHNCPGNPELNCTVHDEVILSVDTVHAEAAKAWVEKHMAAAEREAVLDQDSPIAIDVEVKQSWGGG